MSEKGHKTDILTDAQLRSYLRSALNHLYDPDLLGRNPLAFFLGVADRPDASSELYRIVTQAIESLKPPTGVSPHARAARIYEILLYRYVQQFSQQEVADQLGLSLRHLRREQGAAIEALASRLREQFRLSLEEKDQRKRDGEAPLPETATAVVDHELAWLKETPLEGPTLLEQTLAAVLGLMQPLSTQYRVQVDIALPPALPGLAIHSVALRQILLNLLAVAIHQGAGGRVRISAKPMRWEAELQVSWSRPSGSAPLSQGDLNSLDMARRLAELSACRLALSEKAETFWAVLTIPAFQQFPVLVIDDNADMLELLQRYTAGTRYRLLGTQDPEQAFKLAERVSPQIIVLDVMMPRTDGWELLGRLRHHPLTNHVPVIVCTILAQEELALSLGASAFIQKPVTQQTFLSVLDRLAARAGRGSD